MSATRSRFRWPDTIQLSALNTTDADSNHSSGPISASERAACMCAPVPWFVLRD
jgi:hypothetical protein